MNEGDIIIAFSQFGEIIDCRLTRDKATGKSMGFCFLAYEEQKSTVLAVDNFNGIDLCGRQISVDHVKEYKIPKDYGQNDDEDERDSRDDLSDNSENIDKKLYKPTGPDGKGWGDFR